MNPATWGAVSALGLGTADFVARFSSRAVGPAIALLGMLATGFVLLSIWIGYSQPPLVWSGAGWHLIIINGIATTIMTLLLYWGLARGPVSVVAPIVASHPVLVVAFAVLLGARPTAVDWVAMALTIVGVVIVARSGRSAGPDDIQGPGESAKTIWIATGAMIAYAVLVSAGQSAVPIYGELQTLWMGRAVSLAAIIAHVLFTRQGVYCPMRIWPLLIVQGVLDTGGYLALLSGSGGENAEIAAVTASAFGVVTVLLARMILKEEIGAVQWAGIALIFASVGVLAA